MELGDTITFELKQEHREKSVYGSTNKCIAALALKEYLGKGYDVSVLSSDIIIYDELNNIRYKYYTSEELKKSIEGFDYQHLDEIVFGEHSIVRKK